MSPNAVVTDPPALGIVFSYTEPNCNGDCNAQIDATVYGGTTFSTGNPYTYAWSSGLPPTEDQSNVCAASYTLTATDANNCTATGSVDITQPPVLLANGSKTDITCGTGCDGVLTVAPSGGTPSYTVNWSTGTSDVVAGSGSASLTGLCAGNLFGQHCGCQWLYHLLFCQFYCPPYNYFNHFSNKPNLCKLM